jgi:hypothetical protein
VPASWRKLAEGTMNVWLCGWCIFILKTQLSQRRLHKRSADKIKALLSAKSVKKG